jgi:hypothetical protein
MGKSMSKRKDITGSKNELRDPKGTGAHGAYKNQPVEARGKRKGKKSY